jgi:hypothetical protein
MKLILLIAGPVALFFIWRQSGLHGGLKFLFSAALVSAIAHILPPGIFGHVGTAPPSQTHEKMGCTASERAIKDRLKSPAGANFLDCYSTTRDGTQTVSTSVDSQNSFGASVRSYWVTTVRDGAVTSVVQKQ